MGTPIPNLSPAWSWLHPEELSTVHGPLSDRVVFAYLSQSSPSPPVQEDLCPLQLLKYSHVFLKAVHYDLSSLKLWEEGEGFVCPTLRFCGLSCPSSPVLWQLSRGNEGAESLLCG